ncbi:MAG TPA: hypothetical protein VI279_12430 [Rhodocyclaceae bacterium]
MKRDWLWALLIAAAMPAGCSQDYLLVQAAPAAARGQLTVADSGDARLAIDWQSHHFEGRGRIERHQDLAAERARLGGDTKGYEAEFAGLNDSRTERRLHLVLNAEDGSALRCEIRWNGRHAPQGRCRDSHDADLAISFNAG